MEASSGYSGFFNRQEDIDPVFRENLPAILYFIGRIIPK
jgi:hypothetical protein